MKIRSLLGVMVLVLPLAVAQAAAPAAAAIGGLTWSDEFNGSSLDTSMWKPYNSTYGDGNHEMQCLTLANVTTSVKAGPPPR